ncbi:MAG TPA: hypothetical protein VFQ71_08700 [Gaiellales bacterium]|jgi:hypothetical protein|nr:hypothetical protein [Gaiellales bacterium]
MAAVDAPGLECTWSIQVRRDPAESPPEAASLVEASAPWLRVLERAGYRAFNVYPSHYEPPLAEPAGEAVSRLRALRVTSGIAREPAAGAGARVDVTVSVQDRSEQLRPA